MKIVTEYWPKPIPLRQFDWSAVTDDYDMGCPIGYGRTEQEAITNLLEQTDTDPFGYLLERCRREFCRRYHEDSGL